jgi:hypothetical protein
VSGRPLRFLGATLALWTMGRLAFLLPSEPGVGGVSVTAVAMAATPTATVTPVEPAPARPLPRQARPISRAATTLLAARQVPDPVMPSSEAAISDGIIPPLPPLPIIPAMPSLPTPPDTWSASFWAVARQGGGALLPGGQLGGTQAGVRILRRLDRRGDLSASLRLSAPSEGLGREMAVGLDWKPARRLPLRLIVEQRIALDAGRGGTALLAVAGYGPRSLAPGVTVTAYAQSGVVARGAVARGTVEPFADGAARVSTPLTPAIDLSLGIWGGAQRDTQRLDIGPTLGIALPVAERRIRLSLDWRQRVAGRAAPDSGPALTIADDF